MNLPIKPIPLLSYTNRSSEITDCKGPEEQRSGLVRQKNIGAKAATKLVLDDRTYMKAIFFGLMNPMIRAINVVW